MHTSWSTFCTEKYQAPESNYHLSHSDLTLGPMRQASTCPLNVKEAEIQNQTDQMCHHNITVS